MKNKLLVAIGMIGMAMACNSSQKTASIADQDSQAEESSVTYSKTITEAELKEHLYIYASDEYVGRETGKPGQKKAVAYIKKEYEKLGVAAAKSNGDYIQNVPLEISELPSGTINLNSNEFLIGGHVLALSEIQGSFDNIVYVGFGIEDDGYSDYKGLDIKGKIVLIRAGEPTNIDGTYLFSGSDKKSVWSNMSESLGKRMELAKDKGAKVMLYYDPTNFSRFKNQFKQMKNNANGNMSIKTNDTAKFASVFIDGDFATAILPKIETDQVPKTLSSKIQFNVVSNSEEVDSENVVAFIKGSEKPDEYVIISSHLDHIGINSNGDINNGADDDGSGTVAMLEIAEAFKQAADAGKGPKRSVVFLHVTGEEKGLLGSQYYTDVAPIFPLENTIANLNIDMIGRIDPEREGDRNYIYLIGSDKLSTDLHELSEEVNKRFMNIELDYTFNDENDPNRFYYRSDHYNFAKNNIPIIFYFNGTHADYHKPGDTPDKINYDLLQNRSRLVFHTAWELANRDQRVIADKVSK